MTAVAAFSIADTPDTPDTPATSATSATSVTSPGPGPALTTWIVAAAAVPDGELGIGELAGPYVAADVLARGLRADGRAVVLTSALDEHHPDVVARALRTGRKPDDVAEAFGEAITADWQHAGVAFDGVGRAASDGSHRRRVTEWFARLHAGGALVRRERHLPYCGPCGRWPAGRLLVGCCPDCAAEGPAGACGACLRWNDPGELAVPYCAGCGARAGRRRAARLDFALEPHRDALIDHWVTAQLPPAARAMTERMTAERLPEIPATRPGEWGLPVPVDGYADQRVAAPFQLALSHLTAAETVAEDGPYHAVHFLPRSGLAFHTLLLPALLALAGLPLPRALHVSEPYVTDPDAPLWALDALTAVGPDALRRHVLTHRPSGRPITHRQRELAGTRRHLTGQWNGWLRRLFAEVRSGHGGLVPDALPGGDGWEELRGRVERSAVELRDAYAPGAFAPRRLLALLDEVVASAAEFGWVNDATPDPARRAPALTAQLAVASALSVWAWPVMPQGAARLAAALGVRTPGPVTAAALCAPPPGTRVEPPSGPVFGL
ncbi:class I tRNA ligase family protein [Streptomyces sp. NPDC059002]|uniref:class I tRNA ligase family protein n=1 Tax=Streptomyces sp. NPDC059002 TaxID=3346690 RepID=UPI00368F15EA